MRVKEAEKVMLKKINISSKNQILIINIVLIVVILAVFWQVNHHGFVNLDDDVYVRHNRHIRSGMEGICWAFSSTYAEFWHPLTWVSLILDYQLYGPNAGGYHLTNLILHILSTLLLFWLFNRMTGAIWKSSFVAALFALHPLHVESVAWISERKDVLSAFFWMMTLCLYVYYTEKPVIRRYLSVLFCFVCALMSKPIVITLPLIMILLDYWPLGRFQSQKIEGNMTGVALEKVSLKLLWEKIPFFVLSAVFSIITFYAQHQPYGKGFPLDSRIANAIVSFMTYPIKILWPHGLVVAYPFLVQIPLWQVLGAILLTAIISAAVIIRAKHMPYLFAGWSWYTITILPVIGIIQVGDVAMADRYSYLPSVGIAVMLAWGIPSMIRSEEIRKKILFPAGFAVLAIMAVLSWKQCSYWNNSIDLFSHALRVTKDNFIAHNGFGYALYEKGKMEEAVDQFNEAILIAPRYAYAYNNRGSAYVKLGRYQSAMEDFNKAIDLKQDYADAYNNRAFAYFNQRNIELGCYDAKKACAMGICKALESANAKRDCR